MAAAIGLRLYVALCLVNGRDVLAFGGKAMTFSVRIRSFPARRLIMIGTLAFETISGWSSIEAGTNRWSPVGPAGATVDKIAVSPVNTNLMYVSLASDLYRSSDSGAHWIKADLGLKGRVNALVADQSNPDVVFAGTSTGVYKSSDRGATWISIKRGLGHDYVGLLVADRLNNLYLVNSERDSTPTELYTSRDGGVTWDLLGSDPAFTHNSSHPGCLVVDPLNPDVLYRSRGGSYRSLDAGRTWTPIAVGVARMLAVDPLNPNTIYGAGAGLFRSDDRGDTWTLVNDRAPSPMDFLVIDQVTPSIMYLAARETGLFKSTDKGKSWLPLESGFAGRIAVQALAVSPSDPGVLFTGIRDLGFYGSQDAGATWAPMNTGLPSARQIFGLTPAAEGAFWVGTEYGPYLRNRDGAWRNLLPGLDCDSFQGCWDFRAMVVDPANHQIIYAGTGAGVYKSADGGLNWLRTPPLSSSYPYPQVNALTIDPVYTNIVYAGTSHDSLFKSTDGAGSWVRCSNGIGGSIASLLVSPVSPATLYCAVGVWMYKSTNGGDSWTLLSSSPYLSDDDPQLVRQMALDPLDSDTIFAVGCDSFDRGRVYKSTDAGATWKSVYTHPFEFSHGTAIAVDPVSPATIYAAFFGGGIARSEDAGQTWQLMNTGLPTLEITSLLLDSDDHSVLFAGTYERGVFEYRNHPAGPAELTLTSPNGGESWAVGPVLIRWTTAGTNPPVLRVGIEYSVDNGVTFLQVTPAPNSGEQSVVLPALGPYYFPEALIRISDLDGSSWDASDRPFELRGCLGVGFPSRLTFGAAGGFGQVSHWIPSVCPWTTTSNVSWIRITSGASGVGGNFVRYEVSQNPEGATRTGVLTIGGKYHTVTQSACGQDVSLSQSLLLFAHVGEPCSGVIRASCGTAPYTFTVASGSLPPGLELLPTGAIQGTPLEHGFFSFTVAATDSQGARASHSYSLTVRSGARPRTRLSGSSGQLSR